MEKEFDDMEASAWFKAELAMEVDIAVKAERELVKLRIGFLRQWLNERVGDDLITNEDLEYWLTKVPINPKEMIKYPDIGYCPKCGKLTNRGKDGKCLKCKGESGLSTKK